MVDKVQVKDDQHAALKAVRKIVREHWEAQYAELGGAIYDRLPDPEAGNFMRSCNRYQDLMWTPVFYPALHEIIFTTLQEQQDPEFDDEKNPCRFYQGLYDALVEAGYSYEDLSHHLGEPVVKLADSDSESESESNVERLSRFLNDSSYWSKTVKTGKFPTGVRQMQEVVNNPDGVDGDLVSALRNIAAERLDSRSAWCCCFKQQRDLRTTQFYEAVKGAYTLDNVLEDVEQANPAVVEMNSFVPLR